MFDHVLVPLDGSPLAEQSLDYALRVVKPDGKLTLVTVVPLPDVSMFGYASFAVPYGLLEPASDYAVQESAMLADARNYLTRVADRLQSGSLLQVETVAVTGEPADTIVAQARMREVDAITITTHGRSGINRWLFGSVTMRVLSEAPCPVLVIPSKNIRHEAEAHAAVAEA